MSLLRDVAFTAIGYGLNSFINDNYNSNCDDIEELILDYAHKHDIWGRDQNFYNRLINIAKQFRDPYEREHDI